MLNYYIIFVYGYTVDVDFTDNLDGVSDVAINYAILGTWPNEADGRERLM